MIYRPRPNIWVYSFMNCTNLRIEKTQPELSRQWTLTHPITKHTFLPPKRDGFFFYTKPKKNAIIEQIWPLQGSSDVFYTFYHRGDIDAAPHYSARQHLRFASHGGELAKITLKVNFLVLPLPFFRRPESDYCSCSAERLLFIASDFRSSCGFSQ